MRLQANEIMLAQLFDLVKQFDGNFKFCNNDSAQASRTQNEPSPVLLTDLLPATEVAENRTFGEFGVTFDALRGQASF